jgi:hypothetical protein
MNNRDCKTSADCGYCYGVPLGCKKIGILNIKRKDVHLSLGGRQAVA